MIEPSVASSSSGARRPAANSGEREQRAPAAEPRATYGVTTEGGDGFSAWVAFGVAAFGMAYLVLCVAGRVGSAWPLEWMEGASAVHAQRLLRGLPLYAAPRADFIPFVYPPLSYLPMGLGLLASGGALWGARLASVLAVVLCGIALWRAGKHVSGTHAPGLLAGGLFAMGYGYTGGFIDLARVDAWFCALSLCAVERLCARRHIAGLLLLALACLAKQHAVLLLAAASGGVWLGEGRRGLRAIIVSWLALATCVAALCVWSDGWFWTYCVTVPARHGLAPQLLLSFVLVDLCVYLPLVTGVCAYFVVTRRDPGSSFLSLLLVAAVVASALGRAHPGGDDNVRLPAYALSALVAAIGLYDLLATRPRLRLPLTAALAAQLAMLFQSPVLYWPTQHTAVRFAELEADLTRCAGSNDFAAMDHAGLGGHPFVHALALSDLRMNRDDLADQATRAVLTALGAPAARTGMASSAARDANVREADASRVSLRREQATASEVAGGGDRAGEGLAPRAVAISSSFPALMQTLAEHYELCARAPQLALPTGYKLPETFIYRHKTQ